MKYFSEFQFTVDENQMPSLLKEIQTAYPDLPDKNMLESVFGFLDLTSLSERDNAENISRMCDQVNFLDEGYPGLPSPAAVCVYPALVPIARAKLSNPLVNIASVAGGFPSSQTFLEIKLKEVEMALESGADEIDIVMPVGKFILGLYEEIYEEIRVIKEIMGNRHLKVILETGSLPDLSCVRKASILAMVAGADFIKTSTGKAGEGAKPDSFAIMCFAIKDYYSKTGKKIGIKPAGGISTVESAFEYYSIVDYILGEEWLTPELFRIGASRLANALIRELYKKDENFNYFH